MELKPRITTVELVFLFWDVPVWIVNEIRYSIYNRGKTIARKLGIVP